MKWLFSGKAEDLVPGWKSMEPTCTPSLIMVGQKIVQRIGLTHTSHNVPQSCIHKLPAYKFVHFFAHNTSSSPLLSKCVRKYILNFLLQKHENVPELHACFLAQLTLSCCFKTFYSQRTN